eukprot:GHVU01143252.1.p1 GENE.GHVU01143252.1~~GHVU01143252.1.p1  ORF type:complete len:1114 (+),score=121.79 GHVU01143252.1:380-3721(+)
MPGHQVDNRLETACSTVSFAARARGGGKARYDYVSKAVMELMLRRRRADNSTLRLENANLRAKLEKVRGHLSVHGRIMNYLAENNIPRVCTLVAVQMRDGAAPAQILAQLQKAVAGLYKVRSFSNAERDLCVLVARLGGRRLAHALQESGGLAGHSTIQKWFRNAPQFKFCHGTFNRETVVENIAALLNGQKRGRKIGMCDELKVKEGFDYHPATDVIAGVCCEHVGDHSLRFTSEAAFDEVLQKTVDDSIHLAAEASVFAVADLGRDQTTAKPIMGLGTCRRGGKEAAKTSIEQFLDAWRVGGEQDHGPLVAFATDGDAARRPACNELFRAKEAPDGWGETLRSLQGMDTLCSDTGIVLAPDWKHLIKRFRNTFIHPTRQRKVADFVLTETVLRQWLTARQVPNLLGLMNPSDRMNVNAAKGFLTAVADADADGPIQGIRHNTFAPHLRVLSGICRCLLAPLSSSTSLEEQLQQLSKLGHLLGFLWSLHGASFIPSPLYHDTQSYVKAAYVLTARGQESEEPSELFLSQIGDDQLEELFGVVRTRDHDSSVTTTQLETKLTIGAQVNDVISRNPQWRRPDRRRGPSVNDVIRPRDFTNNVMCGDVDVRQAWRRGRLEAHQLLVQNVANEARVSQYWGTLTRGGPTLLCPGGRIVGVSSARRPRVRNRGDSDDDDERYHSGSEDYVRDSGSEDDQAASGSRDNEDETDALDDFDGSAAESVLPPEMYETTPTANMWLLCDGKAVHKRTYIREAVCMGRMSRDRLTRVRYHATRQLTSHTSVTDQDALETAVCLRDPVATLCVSAGKVCLVVLAVASIRSAGRSTFAISADSLVSQSVEIVGQPLKLECVDAHTLKWGLAESANLFPVTCKCMGKIVQPLSPATVEGAAEPCLHFDLMGLADIAASLWEQHSHLYVASSDVFPPIPDECAPRADDGKLLAVSDAVVTVKKRVTVECPICKAAVVKESMRAHMGSHILTETVHEHTQDTCGFCGGNLCTIEAKKKRAAPVFKCTFSHKYKLASAENAKSACTNVLVKCPICVEEYATTASHADSYFWKYNMLIHWKRFHEGVRMPAELVVNVQSEINRMIKHGVACAGTGSFLSNLQESNNDSTE